MKKLNKNSQDLLIVEGYTNQTIQDWESITKHFETKKIMEYNFEINKLLSSIIFASEELEAKLPYDKEYDWVLILSSSISNNLTKLKKEFMKLQKALDKEKIRKQEKILKTIENNYEKHNKLLKKDIQELKKWIISL